MNETQNDLDKIAHLDFDPEQENGPKCSGYALNTDGVVDNAARPTQINDSCPNKPVLIAVRKCCGVMTYYCMGCYNEVCRFYAKGPGVHDKVCRVAQGNPFAQVTFL